MTQGAYSVHKEIKQELENYIKTQYFGKTPLLFSALKDELSKEGVLYREPYIESSPAYKQEMTGFSNAKIDEWMKSFFNDLAESNLRVYNTPFKHQLEALEAWAKGKDVFVSTGTGSGKTECFLWPIIAKLTQEAKTDISWDQRGIRTIIMYPMNALVSDQLARLRKLIGDPGGEFVEIFRKHAGLSARRPQFGMYTSRTPYPGVAPSSKNDKRLAVTYRKMLKPAEDDETANLYYNALLKNGRVPAKEDLSFFIEELEENRHTTMAEDAELLTRFEMQNCCPDILITNYSMLEYMLLRPREAKIWKNTKKWLRMSPDNKLLLVIDEAHMYRGSSGGEVALLLRRLLHKLEIGLDRVQFILTTASMPNNSQEEKHAVEQFAYDLTGKNDFVRLRGRSQVINNVSEKPLAFVEPYTELIEEIEREDTRLEGLNSFWEEATNGEVTFSSIESAERWMYDHLCEYTPFLGLIEACRGNAVAISDLAEQLYPDLRKEKGEAAVSLLISVAQIARSEKDAVLFPAKMHLLFRGLQGVFACCNENCSHAHADNGVKLGEVIIEDGVFSCPECGSAVYELIQDRRCGAVFFKGYVVEDEMNRGNAYLWHYPGQQLDAQMYELHLYIPPEGYSTLSDNQKIKPCYMNIENGFIDFMDDKHRDDPRYRKLYYSTHKSKDRPDVMTMATCPHCQKAMSKLRLTSFATRGNQSFNNLIKAQFNVEDPVIDRLRDPKKYPNAGRKVLLFSDSRQTAAKLARDMSAEATAAATRELFMCAVKKIMDEKKETSLDEVYGYLLHQALSKNVVIFDEKFSEDCRRLGQEERRNQNLPKGRRKPVDLTKYTVSKNSKEDLQEQLLRLFCGNYNTLTQDALVWVEPMDEVLDNIVFDVSTALNIDINDDNAYRALQEETIELFSAWFSEICDAHQAIGHTITNGVRNRVRKNFMEGFGLASNWKFNKVISESKGWDKDSEKMRAFQRAFTDNLLERSTSENDSYFVKLDAVKPLYDPEHNWYRCKKCSEIAPYLLDSKCPSCGSDDVDIMSDDDYEALAFWRNPAIDAMNGAPVRVIDTEEHTAQLSHKDQMDDMWSKTEEYELRFQDMVKDGEGPVDILSSTTTMEVGIDIGSLVAVGLRNVPPMRENYQQRAGRAGRDGSSLSTIVTFCENGPYDALYFNEPVPMFRGDLRRPWIDIDSKKLLCRHMNMLVIQKYLSIDTNIGYGMTGAAASDFLEDNYLNGFFRFLNGHHFRDSEMLLGKSHMNLNEEYKEELYKSLMALKEKCDYHPELYKNEHGEGTKSLLDALYEEGIIPTYSFPNNVVSLFVRKKNKELRRMTTEYQVERGLDVAISEYAPGRTVVIDKKTYQVGGLFYPGFEYAKDKSPASAISMDPNYNKPISSCSCGWFGIQDGTIEECPFCGNQSLSQEYPMIRPWGFAPKNARPYESSQVEEEYSTMMEPLYSTLSTAEEMSDISGFEHVRKSSRVDQSIIMLNKGPSAAGFQLCTDCGAIMPAAKDKPLNDVVRPYTPMFGSQKCSHSNAIEVNLGFEQMTDLLVLEFELNKRLIDTKWFPNPWMRRAAASLSEGIHMVACEMMDIEFSELITGSRIRNRENAESAFIDVYLYDSLSSGAGYSEYLANHVEEVLRKTYVFLQRCDCESACYKCLKHYRNQYLQSRLDRHAAIDLLNWAKDGRLPEDYSVDKQWEIIKPLNSILSDSGVALTRKNDKIIASNGKFERSLIIYPAMKRKSHQHDVIYVSDYVLKYAKPTGVEYILGAF